MSTVQEIVESAMRVVGIIAPGETPQDGELQDGIQALNMMLGTWSNERIIVHYLTEDTKVLTAGDGTYSIGSGGDIDTARPTQIIRAFTRGSGVDYPIKIIDEKKYHEIATKDFGGVPSWLYYNPAFTLGEIYLYPYPESALTLYLYSIKPFTTYTALTTTVSLPDGYDRAIKYNLALDLAPEYGREPPPVVIAMAKVSKGELQSMNAANQLKTVKLEILRLARSWSIAEG